MGGRDVVPGYSGDSGDRATLPGLVEFLSAVSYEDGSTREPGTVTLFCGDGRVKARINDKDGGLVAFVTLSCLLDGLTELERDLQGNNLDWRNDKFSGKKK